MKKLISSCSVLTLLAAFTSVFAGGIELPPPPMDYFSGFTIGIMGSFWHNSWNVDGEARTVCNNSIGQYYTGFDGLTEEVYDWTGYFGTCVSPVGKTYLDEAGAEVGAFGAVLSNPIVGIFSNDGDGTDKTGAIGAQLTYGKVFQGEAMGYYLGIYGGGQWGNSSDTINYTWDTKNLAALFDLVGLGSQEIWRQVGIMDTFDQPVHAELSTKVEMENVYDVGAQLGLLFTPKTMGYLKVGAAWSEISAHTCFNLDFPNLLVPGFFHSMIVDGKVNLLDSRIDLSGFASTSVEDTEIGYELGAGVSQAITENLILSLEYVFRNFGTVTAGQGEIFIPEALFHSTKDIGVRELESGEDIGTIVTDGSVQDPLFFQATRASAKLHQSAFNAVLAYHFNWLQ